MTQQMVQQFVLEVQQSGRGDSYRSTGESENQAWHVPSTTMSDRVVSQAAERLAEHATVHGIDRVQVVLRGSDPLRIGPSGLRWMIRTLRAALDGVAAIDLSLHTSGVELDERFAELFLAADVQVVLSVDAGRWVHDRRRRFLPGRAGYDPVVRAVRLLNSPDFRPVFAGLRCPVDVAADPGQVLRDLVALDPPTIDLVLPETSWEHPVPEARPGLPSQLSLPGQSGLPGVPSRPGLPGQAAHGDWLSEVFDGWYSAPPQVSIRLFEVIMQALLSGATREDVIGLCTSRSLVIEPDGAVQPVAAGRTIFEHSLDDVLDRPVGPLMHSRDLTRLINHIQHRMAVDLTAQPAQPPTPPRSPVLPTKVAAAHHFFGQNSWLA